MEFVCIALNLQLYLFFDIHRSNSNPSGSCSDQLGLMNSLQNGYPKHSREQYGENQWSACINNKLKYYIRNQDRTGIKTLGIKEDEIDFAGLKKYCIDTVNGEQYWFHATTWEKAQRFIESGPSFIEKPGDFTANGAFYLNPSYTDCYDWFIQSNDRFKGSHAMLIYMFDPEKINKKGEKLTLDEWKRTAVKRNITTRKGNPDWSYVFQNADPKNIPKMGKNQKKRITKDGEDAMQLVIRRQKMCTRIHSCMVGCVFYRYVTPNNKGNQNHPRSVIEPNTTNDNLSKIEQLEESDSDDDSGSELNDKSQTEKYI